MFEKVPQKSNATSNRNYKTSAACLCRTLWCWRYAFIAFTRASGFPTEVSTKRGKLIENRIFFEILINCALKRHPGDMLAMQTIKHNRPSVLPVSRATDEII